MKHFIKHLLSGLCLSLVSITALAAQEQIEIDLQPTEREKPSKGNRIPAPHVTCTIDFDDLRIESAIPYEITAYELWDEDGTIPIVTYATDYGLAEYLSGISGEYQLRLVTDNRTYVGYLEL